MNPVLQKDLLGLLRLRRIAVMQIAFVAALALLVLATWPQGGVLTQALQGRDNLLLGLVIAQIVLLILFVPGIAAVSLSGEREANTLEMLYASRLSPMEIVFGKLMSAISYPMLLLAAGLPFVALLAWRGDVTTASLLQAYLVLIVTAVLLAVISLTISVLSSQSSTALVISYLTVLGFCGAVLVPAALMLRQQSGMTAMLLHYGRSVSPIAAALSLLQPALGGFGDNPQGLAPSWQIFLPLSVIVIAACLGILVMKLSRPPAAREGFGGGVTGEQQSAVRRALVLIDPNKQRKPIGSMNPVLAKEARTSNLRSGRWMIRIFYASLLLSFALAAMSLAGGAENEDLLEGVAIVVAAFQIALIGLVTPSLTSSAISGEIESGNFEMLRLTPLSGWRIFWGKFIPAFGPALLPIVALVPAYLVISFVNPKYLPHVMRLVPIAVMAVAFCCTLGLTVSSFISNTARATVISYLITAAVFVVPLLGWLAADNQISRDLAQWIVLPSPLVMSLAQLPDAARQFPEAYQLYATHLVLIGIACVAMLVLARLRLDVLLKRG